MNATAIDAAGRKPRALLLTTLGVLGLLALAFIARSALPYFQMSPDHLGPYFWPRRWGLIAHVAGGVIALGLGVIQLWLGLTNRTAGLHRALGKLYVLVIAVGSVAGFYLSLTIPSNLPYAAGLFTLCVAWVITTFMAVLAIRRRDVLQHREWMMRSYAVTFAFVTFRFGVEALTRAGVSLGDAQVVMAWACWAVPLLALEPLIQLRRLRGATSA